MRPTLAEAAPTVFVVDDDEALRDAMATLLEAEGLACETYADAASFLDGLADWRPESCACLVLDLRLPGPSGLDVQERLNACGIDVPVVFVTGYGDLPSAVRAMKGGAVDFLAKPFDTEVLLARIREALHGHAQRRDARCGLAAIRACAATLSPRERQVFERVAAGEANKSVAMELGISTRTVEIHRSRLMKKMHARSLAELVRMKLALDDDRSGS